MPAGGHRAEKSARREERRGQIRTNGRVPALERELPHRHVALRPLAGDRGTDVERANLFEERIDLVLDGQIGLDDVAADLGSDGLGALASVAVVDDHVRAFGGERASAGRADPSGAAGHEHALPCEAGLHGLRGYRREGSHHQRHGRRRRHRQVAAGDAAASRCTRRAGGSTPRRSTRRCAARRPPARRRSSSWTATARAAAGRSTRSMPELLDPACECVVQEEWTSYTGFLE